MISISVNTESYPVLTSWDQERVGSGKAPFVRHWKWMGFPCFALMKTCWLATSSFPCRITKDWGADLTFKWILTSWLMGNTRHLYTLLSSGRTSLISNVLLLAKDSTRSFLVILWLPCCSKSVPLYQIRIFASVILSGKFSWIQMWMQIPLQLPTYSHHHLPPGSSGWHRCARPQSVHDSSSLIECSYCLDWRCWTPHSHYSNYHHIHHHHRCHFGSPPSQQVLLNLK